jgi:hypothetical protein
MTKNIIEMAKEAGIRYETIEFYQQELTAFAKLVAAKEREACAKLVDYWEAREGEHADAIRARGEA